MSKKCHKAPRVKQQFIIWLNILIQATFPLAVACTPAIAGTNTDSNNSQHFLRNSEAQLTLHTNVYTLASGETVAQVAQKYNMTPDALRKLNQLRTFAHGFDHLLPGDELDVPAAPLPKIHWDDGKTAENSSISNVYSDEQAQKIAGVASQAGGFLANSPDGDASASMLRGMATNEAGGQIQQWLSRFGTARVQLDADENFSLKNSQFDLLLPLYEQKDKLVFTQGSFHRTDDRNQANLGAGLRWFNDGWMLGGNTFFDYDLSREHARAGAGVEYWRDFMRLGANSYMRLTGWKDSPDVTDYEERPANGWDVRAQAWLPALPQLGGKLVFEQYDLTRVMWTRP